MPHSVGFLQRSCLSSTVFHAFKMLLVQNHNAGQFDTESRRRNPVLIVCASTRSTRSLIVCASLGRSGSRGSDSDSFFRTDRCMSLGRPLLLFPLVFLLCLEAAVPPRRMGPKKKTHPGVTDKAISKKKEAPAPAVDDGPSADPSGAIVIEAW